MRFKGEEYRFIQKVIDESVADVAVDASDFAVEAIDDSDVMFFKDKKMSTRAVKDMSRILKIPRHLLFESSDTTLKRLIAERLKFLEIAELTMADYDGKVALVTPKHPDEYRSPAVAIPEEGKDFVAWADPLHSDVARLWVPEKEFSFEGQKYAVGSRFLAHTTTKNFMLAESRLEKVICSNGLMGLVESLGASKITMAIDEGVLEAFFEERVKETQIAMDRAIALFTAASEIPCNDPDEALASMVDRGGLTPRAGRKISVKLRDLMNPELASWRIEKAGVPGPMHTALDFIQAAAFYAQKYSDNSRESVERMLGTYAYSEFVELDSEHRPEAWGEREVA